MRSDHQALQFCRKYARSLMARGESTVAPLGVGFVALLLGALLVTGYLLSQSHHHHAQQVRYAEVESAATLLVEASGHMLAEGKLTPVRRMLMDLSDRPSIENARIVLPDGQILAHAEPALANTEFVEARWEQDPPGSFEARWHDTPNHRTLIQPLAVPGRGGATLHLDVPHQTFDPVATAAHPAVGIVGAGSLALLLMLYRYGRYRLRAVSRVREALHSLAEGEPSSEALVVDHTLGQAAGAWNQLLEDRQHLQRELQLHKQPTDLAVDRASADLARGCDVMPQGMILVDEHQQIGFANHAAALFFSLDRAQMTGKDLDHVIEDPDLLLTVRQTCQGQQRRHMNHEIERRDDSGKTVGVMRIGIHPVRHEQHTAAMLLIEDMTQQRVAEASRHEFIAQATHELRAPLTNMRLYIEDAQDRGQEDPSVQAQAINVLNQETFRLERMVEDMLSVSQIEAGAMQMRNDDVRVDALLTDLVEDYKAQARDKSIDLELDLPPKLPVIHGDRDRLMIAGQNLLSNAIKYTSDEGSVKVSAELHNNDLRIAFQDNGFGISPEDQQRIFEKFYRAASDQRVGQITGTGLGLALSLEIIRLHGGDIEIESEPDRGSTFTINLPIQTSPAATET